MAHVPASLKFGVSRPQDPTIEQRREALYHSTFAHAYAGDLEFAQVTLRGALEHFKTVLRIEGSHGTMLLLPCLRLVKRATTRCHCFSHTHLHLLSSSPVCSQFVLLLQMLL